MVGLRAGLSAWSACLAVFSQPRLASLWRVAFGECGVPWGWWVGEKKGPFGEKNIPRQKKKGGVREKIAPQASKISPGVFIYTGSAVQLVGI